jgi:hypothetical protein
MPKAYSTWTVHPHGSIEKLTDNIWRVVGSMPGPPIPRTMVLVRLRDGRLVVHSAVALDDATMKEIESCRVIGFTGPIKLPPITKLLLVKNKGALRADLERLAETPDLRRIVPSHGDVVTSDPAGALRRVAASL